MRWPVNGGDDWLAQIFNQICQCPPRVCKAPSLLQRLGMRLFNIHNIIHNVIHNVIHNIWANGKGFSFACQDHDAYACHSGTRTAFRYDER